jgi:hypothetical protein
MTIPDPGTTGTGPPRPGLARLLLASLPVSPGDWLVYTVLTAAARLVLHLPVLTGIAVTAVTIVIVGAVTAAGRYRHHTDGRDQEAGGDDGS